MPATTIILEEACVTHDGKIKACQKHDQSITVLQAKPGIHLSSRSLYEGVHGNELVKAEGSCYSSFSKMVAGIKSYLIQFSLEPPCRNRIV